MALSGETAAALVPPGSPAEFGELVLWMAAMLQCGPAVGGLSVLQGTAHDPTHCRPAHALPRRPADVRLRLLGSHQLDNAAAAVAAAACLRRHGLERISLPAVAAGLEAATLPGRFQVCLGAPRVLA